MNLDDILNKNRQRLRRLIDLRIDRRLQARVDASDVIQETFIEATKRFDGYADERAVSPYVWLRFLACQKLNQLHRKHLGAQARAADREVSVNQQVGPSATSAVMAIDLLDQGLSPSQIVAGKERASQMQDLIESMSEDDREIIALRNFEQLSKVEVAEILQISTDAAYKRYVRAIQKLRALMGGKST
jgi:RNA polymerase sigma-70 factor (ECF subfamily)